jgi:hypothetical protein
MKIWLWFQTVGTSSLPPAEAGKNPVDNAVFLMIFAIAVSLEKTL